MESYNVYPFWPVSVNKMYLGFKHVNQWLIPFFLLSSTSSYECTIMVFKIFFLIHSSEEEHLEFFQVFGDYK